MSSTGVNQPCRDRKTGTTARTVFGMTRRFDLGAEPARPPRLDGQPIVGVPVRFYHRRVLGVGVFGLWVGGRPVYDVAVYDPAGRHVGRIGSETSPARQMYDDLRRVLVAEEIHA